jgi:hypothetical protein
LKLLCARSSISSPCYCASMIIFLNRANFASRNFTSCSSILRICTCNGDNRRKLLKVPTLGIASAATHEFYSCSGSGLYSVSSIYYPVFLDFNKEVYGRSNIADSPASCYNVSTNLNIILVSCNLEMGHGRRLDLAIFPPFATARSPLSSSFFVIPSPHRICCK